jgi:hypothetical protein
MFNFDVKISNGKLVSTLNNEHVQYCIVWSEESIASILVTDGGQDGALEFYYLPTKSK